MAEETGKYRSIATLNVREAPSASSKALGRLVVDEVIEKIGESEDGQWIQFRFKDAEAWSSAKFLAKVPYIPPPGEDFPWMAIAEAEQGISEIPGRGNNPRVLEYLRSTENLGTHALSRDETPWCSAFVNWCLQQAGYEPTKNALARSWLYWGQEVETPRRGCIVIFRRERIYGHVGFYLGETETHIKVLGGNQHNPQTKIFEVSEKYYPKSELMGYRIPK
ncbi:MAG: TIGR02594 family protein [Anaerolineales bacterium]|nr:MAG: TIGR02594 family protein [Anaerolineales bacterium]